MFRRTPEEPGPPSRNRNNRSNRRGRGGGGAASNRPQTEDNHRSYEASDIEARWNSLFGPEEPAPARSNVNNSRREQDIPSLFDYRPATVPQWTETDPVWGANAEPAQARRNNRSGRGGRGGARQHSHRTADPIIVDMFGNVRSPWHTEGEWTGPYSPPSSVRQRDRGLEPASSRGNRGRRGGGRGAPHQPVSRAVPPHFLFGGGSDDDSDNTSIFSLLFEPEPTPARRNNRNRGGRGGARQQENRAAPSPASSRNNASGGFSWSTPSQDNRPASSAQENRAPTPPRNTYRANRETWDDHPFQRPEILFPNADDEWGTDGGWGGRRREEPVAAAESTRAPRRNNRNRGGRGGARQQENRTTPADRPQALSARANNNDRPQALSARADNNGDTTGRSEPWEFGSGGFDDAENAVPAVPATGRTPGRNRNRGGRRGGGAAREQYVPPPSRDSRADDSLQDAFGNLDISRDDNDWGADWGGGFAIEERAPSGARATESRAARRNRNRRLNQNRRRNEAQAAASGRNPLDPANAEITSNEWSRIVNPVRHQARNNNNTWPSVPPGFGYENRPPPGQRLPARSRGNIFTDRLRREGELRAEDLYSFMDDMGGPREIVTARFPRSPFDFGGFGIPDYGAYLGVDDNFSDDLTVSSTPEPEDPEKTERLKQARDVDLQDDTLAMRYSRACGVCQISPNPRVRFVLTGCGHIVCAPCSEQLDNVGRKVRCPFCRVTGGLLRLFEELEEEGASCQTSA